MARIFTSFVCLVLTAVLAMPAMVSAQAAPPAPNLLKIRPGMDGSDSVRIRVRHDPGTFKPESWSVIDQTPGTNNSVELACDWGVTGPPADVGGLFFCDLFGLAEGNHFFTLQATNVARTTPEPNTYSWHTAGPATGIVDPGLPGSFATEGPAGTWAAGSLTAPSPSPQRFNFEFPAYSASDALYPVLGYFIEVETATGTARFASAGTSLLAFVPSTVNGAAVISAYPVTSRGLINDPQVTNITISDRLANYKNATTVDGIVNAGNYQDADAAVLRYYVAFFNRQPDLDGAMYWLDIRRQGFTPAEIADFFSQSEEFFNDYAGTSDNVYLTRVYSNVLGRDFDQGGFDYWLDLLQGTNASGNNAARAKISRSQIVFFIAQSAEFIRENPFLPAD